MSGNKELAISLSIIGVIVLIILGFTFLPDMIKEWKRKASIVDFEQEEAYIVDENGNKFYMLNNCVEAMAKTGLYGRLDGVEYYYITKMGKEGEKPLFIVEYFEDSLGFVYRREDAEDLTLESFTPISADICLGATDYPIDYLVAHDKYLENGGNKSNDEPLINMIVDSLTKGAEVDMPMKQKSLWQIKLKSKEYPGLYFTVQFITDINGISYLYNPLDGKYVKAPDELKLGIEG